MRIIPGINIQWPWSQMLLSGAKTIETRTYKIPQKYIGVELALIETPGALGKKKAGILKARIIGTITFGCCVQYETKHAWIADVSKHLVNLDDAKFGFDDRKEKWGWCVVDFKKFTKIIPVPKKRGIIFAKECEVF